MLNERWNVPFWLCLSTLTVAALHAQAQPGAQVTHKPASQAEVVEGGAEMPEVIHYGGRPVFVAAEKLFLPSGDLDPTFSETRSDAIQRIFESPEQDGCLRYEWLSSFDEAPYGVYNLATALNYVDNVIIAEVTGRRPGFLDSRPGMLLRISIAERLKGQFPRRDSYMFYAGGDFLLSGRMICTSNPNFGPIPELRDRVLILFTNHLSNFENELLGTSAVGIFVLKENRPVVLPKFYRARDVQLKNLTPKAFVDGIVELIRKGEEK